MATFFAIRDVLSVKRKKVRLRQVAKSDSFIKSLSFDEGHPDRVFTDMADETIRLVSEDRPLFISACLCGAGCAYDGRPRFSENVKRLEESTTTVSACPELLGRLGCPREKHEIFEGTGEDVLKGEARVLSYSGKDRTEMFIEGARKALDICLREKCKTAVMREGSPSCGVNFISSGRFDGKKHPGKGVTSALLSTSGIWVLSELDIGSL